MTFSSDKKTYRSDIDGIRAIAILMVLIFHFRLAPGSDSGFMGVDVFFVISGFLITTIVHSQLQADSFRLGHFWTQRVRRLAPALLATTLLVLGVGWLGLFPEEFTKLAQQTLVAQLYVANIFFWQNVDYFGLQADQVYLLHTWSLAVEEQFYIVFPLLFWLSFRWARQHLRVIIYLTALVSFGLNLAFVEAKPAATFYLMPTRAWELLAGSALALHVGGMSRHRPWLAEVAGACGVLGLLLTLLGYRDGVLFPGFFAVIPVVAAMLLIWAGSLSRGRVTAALGLPPLRLLGQISYPLYLVHWPVNVLAAAELGAGYTWPWRMAAFALSVLLAWVIYIGVEKPVRRWLDRLPTSTVLGVYGVAVACVVALCWFVVRAHGVPDRFASQVIKLASYSGDTPPPLRECEYHGQTAFPDGSLCRLGAVDTEPDWFIYGDSHAWAASGALDWWLKASGRSAHFVFLHACPPVSGVYVSHESLSCPQFNRAAADYVLRHNGIANLLLISTWHQAREGRLVGGPNEGTSPEASVALFQRGLAASLERFNKAGKRVFIWEPLPGAKASVPQAMAKAAWRQTEKNTDHSLSDYREDYAFFFEELVKHRALIAGTFSPSLELCGSGTCITEKDGVPLYFDGSHLSYSMSPFWAQALARQLRP